MKLIEAQARRFRNIIDSTPVKVQADVTCLVGKNESGKTAFLKCLYLLNPARPNAEYSVRDQYPAWLEKKDRQRGEILEQFTPISTTFLIEKEDREAIEKRFGAGVLPSPTFTVARKYDGGRVLDFAADEKTAVGNIVSGTSLRTDLQAEAAKAQTFTTLNEVVASFEERAEDVEAAQAAAALKARIAATIGEKNLDGAMSDALVERLPELFYYSDYSNLPYTVKIRELLQAVPETLDDEQLTALSLLRMAGADGDYLLNPDYERRKRELENVANSLTADVLKYWTQNPELRVMPDITQKTESLPNGRHAVVDELKIRIWDQRHSLSLPFDEHSTGFQWFFSFLAAFSEYEFKQTPVIILLDEPALGLHARAQADFLRFIEERLAPRCQVIYTTHSPFMIQPGKLDRVRVVEDRGRTEGSRISKDVFTVDRDTLFPLQGALGYDLAQHLFVSPHNLVVEGTSDYVFLVTVSDFLKAQPGRAFLDDRWSVIPVGGVDTVPTFVALLGQHLEITVVIDAQRAGHQRLSNLAATGYLSEKRILTVGQVLGRKLADIEDLFTEDDYLMLFNQAFGKKVKAGDLPGKDPIVTRVARQQGIDRFDHGRPADVLLRNRDELLPKLAAATIQNFEKLFTMVNDTLGTK
jgi:energy-coupling factor transporter ATP-binding protein EcfA2